MSHFKPYPANKSFSAERIAAKMPPMLWIPIGLDLAGQVSYNTCNKTRQGYARKRILKPAGYFFVGPEL